MFFGGGFPGFEQAGGPREVDNDEYYEALGVSKNASTAEIKKAYRKLAIKHHPDKGGDQETFKKISEAYDVLGTPEKKEIYDRHGKEGLEQGGAGARSAQDVFSMFFGGGGRQRNAGPQKGKDLVHEVAVSLEELYSSKVRKLAISRKRAKYPEGLDKHTAVENCPECGGQGQKTKLVRVGPGMMTQTTQPCDGCKGEGKRYKRGVTTAKVKKVLELCIERGMKNGQKLVFQGESDELPGKLAGDVIFVLREKEHDTFKRKGADLLIEKEISLKQALCGFEFAVTHLDGKKVIVKSEPMKTIEPNSIKALPDMGMPIHKRPFEHGRLFIFFKVQFPTSISAKQNSLLKAALPQTDLDKKEEKEKVQRTKDRLKSEKAAAKSNGDMDVELSYEEEEAPPMIDMTVDDIGKVKASAESATAYDSDDEEEGGRRGVQCQHQ